MCGRFTLTADPRAVAEYFTLPDFPAVFPRYNIAPGQNVPVVVQTDAVRQLRPMKWGLVPSWAKDAAIGYRSINARSETAADKPTFRAAFKRRHCLVPATGFYEWRGAGKHKLPVHFKPVSGFFAFAGLWETWQDGALSLETCTILTTTANELVRPFHDRMPVILDPGDFAAWLIPSGEKERDLQLFRPYPTEAMTAAAANPWVNDARHEGPKCLEPPDDQPSLFGA
jgi:putative SOS response-associated peptidase YedK